MTETEEPSSLRIRDVVVAVFGLNAQQKPQRFLGTGSIIGDGSVLLTADHVTRDWQGPLGIVVMKHLPRVFGIHLIERDPGHDLALFRIDEYRPSRPLVVEFDEKPENSSLITYEYGTTVISGNNVKLNPAQRIGHMTREIDVSDRFGPAGKDAMELSYPALRGASGAPVLINELVRDSMLGKTTLGLVGVVIANAAYHLLPTQIESVLTQDNALYEEVRYMMPLGLAVSVRHLRPMYERAMHTGRP